ncbi:hypothetical protein TKK_0000768 [Trichogramma kaykai]
MEHIILDTIYPEHSIRAWVNCTAHVEQAVAEADRALLYEKMGIVISVHCHMISRSGWENLGPLLGWELFLQFMNKPVGSDLPKNYTFYRIMYGERHDGMQFDHQIADNRLVLEANGTTYNVGYRIQFVFYPWWRQSFEQSFPTLFTLPSIEYYKTVFNLYESFKYLLSLAAHYDECYQVLMHLNFTVNRSISG